MLPAILALACSAPVPPYRPLSPAAVPGEYRLGEHWMVALLSDGRYVCTQNSGPDVWEGTWRIDGRTVRIDCRRRGEDGTPGVSVPWDATFPRHHKGEANTRWGPMRRVGR